MKKSLSLLLLIFALTFVTACGSKTAEGPEGASLEREAPDAMMEKKPEGDAMMEKKMEGEAIEMDGTYTLDPASTLGWSAKRLAANPHVGTVGIQSGELVFEGGEFVSGQFVIDMNTITDEKNNERFLGHVRSDDFFAVEQFPTATLEVTGWQGGQVAGNLTIRDKTNAISFPANVEMADGKLTATAQFDIDRTKWGIVFDSGSVFQNLGDRAIKDEISYDLNLVMTQN